MKGPTRSPGQGNPAARDASHLAALPARERLLPVVALWGYIPSYARYSAPAAGMLTAVEPPPTPA